MDMTIDKILMIALQVIGAGFVGILWFNFRELKSIASITQRELHEYKLHVAENYATTRELSKAIDAMNETMKAVFAKLDRIEEKLDHKQDKP